MIWRVQLAVYTVATVIAWGKVVLQHMDLTVIALHTRNDSAESAGL
jgi:hypothetical protein